MSFYFLFILVAILLPIIYIGTSIYFIFKKRYELFIMVSVGIIIGIVWGTVTSDTYTASVIIPFNTYITTSIAFIVGVGIITYKYLRKEKKPI